MNPTRNSRHRMQRAVKSIPGGVNSNARTTQNEITWQRAEGGKLYDTEGKEYIDLVLGYGPIILGHANRALNQVVSEAVEEESLYPTGASEAEIAAAETVVSHIPCAEKVHFAMSGSEAVAHALRLARGVTGRNKIIKFEGAYHGWYDSVAMNHLPDGTQAGTRTPFTRGVVNELVQKTIVLPFNDTDAVEEALRTQGDDIAAIIVEPILHSVGCVRPRNDFLRELRLLANEHGSLLIFDEIVTGFRHDIGGAQRTEGVTPDLAIMAKAVANGYPVSLVCGPEHFMDEFSTAGGDVIWTGTYNGHPASMAAVKETVTQLEERNVPSHLSTLCEHIVSGIGDCIEDLGITATVERYGGIWLIYFMDSPVTDYEDVLRNDVEKYERYRNELIKRGIFTDTNDVRRQFLCASHTETDARRIVEASEEALKVVAE